LGIGDWGLGIGDWAIPNPQSPIPNPQQTILHITYFTYKFIINKILKLNYITY